MYRYLPLGIVLAGKMISSYGQNWETEVLELLQDSHSEELRQQSVKGRGGGGAGEVGSTSTVEHHIIDVTLRTIRGPQAAEVKQLFRWMGM